MMEKTLKTTHAFSLGDRVRKIKGASWTGRVVGFYETGLTPIGYCVESENEPGSVQIYPESALTLVTENRRTPPAVEDGAAGVEVVWLIEHDGRILEAIRGDDVLAMRRRSFDYATFTPLVPAAALDQATRRAEQYRKQWKEADTEACNGRVKVGRLNDLMKQAADALTKTTERAEAAEADVAILRQALEPFASWRELDAYDGDTYVDCTFQASAFRRARAALGGGTHE